MLNLLKSFSKIYREFLFFLVKILSTIFLTSIYLIIIIPINLIVRILRIDLINKDISNRVESYWIKRKNRKINFKDQF